MEDVWNADHKVYKGYEYVQFYFESEVMQHFTGYVKLPDAHPAVAKLSKRRWSTFFSNKRRYLYSYDDVEINVHGGLTFGEKITKRTLHNYLQPFTPGWWIGWDYLHAGDEVYLPRERIIEKDEHIQEVYASLMAIHENPQRPGLFGLPDKRWTWGEVEEDCKDVIEQLISQERR
jgi:hypothetical protein